MSITHGLELDAVARGFGDRGDAQRLCRAAGTGAGMQIAVEKGANWFPEQENSETDVTLNDR